MSFVESYEERKNESGIYTFVNTPGVDMIVEQVYEMLARVRAAGTALLVIEQHVSHALALCDRVVLLDHGTVAWTGPASEAESHVQSQLGA